MRRDNLRRLGVRLAVAASVLLSPTATARAQTTFFSGLVDLLCDIPEYATGTNVVSNLRGTGLTFDGTTSPLVNPTLTITGSALRYTFSATLAAPASAMVSGLGTGMITSMMIDVDVGASQFTQPGGPGTTIFVDAANITPGSAERLHGIFVRGMDGSAHVFDVILSSFTLGSVLLEPESADPITGLERKRLDIQSASISGQISAVPEPASVALVATGLACTFGITRSARRRRNFPAEGCS
jgi:hypothetical protein